MDESKIELTERLRREYRWEEAAKLKDSARADFRANGIQRQEANEAAWEAMAEAYPPLPKDPVSAVRPTLGSQAGVTGLGMIPDHWPNLSANASLPAELRWVQANRLSVVVEKSHSRTIVHLDRAHEPAPSRSALSWLETSIRNYTKFTDIVARNLKNEEEQADNIKRERMAIAEIEALLSEMHED
jgi:hypothetical protein